jgi:hypothetical protein
MRSYTLGNVFTKSRTIFQKISGIFLFDLKYQLGVHFHIYKKRAKSNQGELEEKIK